MYHKLSEADILAIVFNGLFGIIAVYLMVSLIRFEMLKHRKSSGKHNKKSQFLRSLCIVASTLASLHHLGEIASFFLENQHQTCTALEIVWLATYALGLMATYIFLWTRQHVINTSPTVSYIKKKRILVLSWSLLVILILGIVMAFLAGSRLIFFSNCSETANSPKLKRYTIILSGILLSLTAVGQIQLLMLFVIPLIKHHRQAQTAFPSSNRSSTTKKSAINKNMLMVKRCVVVATLCVITDVTAAVVTITVQHPTAKLAYDFNLLVNAACCVFSFRKWSKMLLVFNCHEQTKSLASTSEHEVPTEASSKV